MIKYSSDNNLNYLDITELNNLRNAQSKFLREKSNKTFKKQYFDTTEKFLDWYINYCNEILKGKIYKDKQVSEYIFKEEFKNARQFNLSILIHLYTSKTYVDYIKSQITKNNIHKYSHELSHLEIDIEWLVATYEVNCKKSVTKISLNSGRRRNLTPTDIYSAANTLFYIEEFDNIEDLYLRDLKPIVMFQIRQLLEVFGKDLLGYISIQDKNGKNIKKFTQIAWEFIKVETSKNDSKISLPFELSIIIAINNWANNFVHTTFLHNSYIQFFALKAIKILFNTDNKRIKIYNGNFVRKFLLGDIKISNYNLLKLDFENYLSDKMDNVTVKWMEIKNVGAYIISE